MNNTLYCIGKWPRALKPFNLLYSHHTHRERNCVNLQKLRSGGLPFSFLSFCLFFHLCPLFELWANIFVICVCKISVHNWMHFPDGRSQSSESNAKHHTDTHFSVLSISQKETFSRHPGRMLTTGKWLWMAMRWPNVWIGQIHFSMVTHIFYISSRQESTFPFQVFNQMCIQCSWM